MGSNGVTGNGGGAEAPKTVKMAFASDAQRLEVYIGETDVQLATFFKHYPEGFVRIDKELWENLVGALLQKERDARG